MLTLLMKQAGELLNGQCPQNSRDSVSEAGRAGRQEVAEMLEILTQNKSEVNFFFDIFIGV